jgi:hypothetical protein
MLDTENLDIVSVCTYTVDPDGHDLHTEISLQVSLFHVIFKSLLMDAYLKTFRVWV